MITHLRKQFVVITMSLLTVVVAFLFALSNYYGKYWDDFDDYRLVKMVAQNDYMTIPNDETIALASISSDKDIAIQVNNTYLSNDDVESLVTKMVKKGKKKRQLDGYTYAIKETKDGQVTVAFIDSNQFGNTFDQLLVEVSFTIFGFLLLTGVSLYLSRFIVKPAQNALEREKQFVSDASHELKTPIAAIRANAQVLKSEGQDSRYLEHILSESKRMEGLVQQLLGLTRLETGTAKAEKTVINLSEVLEEMLLNYESLAFEDGKMISETIENNITIQANEGQVKQLIAILLDNAIKHSSDASQITVDLKQEKKKVLLTVANASEVYPEHIMPHLFNRFYQAESSHHQSESFGLGLSIAKAITANEKGTITITQQDGQFITQIALPAHQVH